MKMMANYLFLEGKRSFYVLKKSIVSIICVLLALGTIVGGMYFIMVKTTLFPKIEVGIVIPKEDTLLEMISSYISAMESVESVCDFQYVSQEEGERMLSDGELQVVVILPAALYDDINHLEEAKATILLREEGQVGVTMFAEILSNGLKLLHIAVAGVEASYDVTKGENLHISRGQIGNFLGTKYALHALDRMDTFDEILISPMGNLAMLQFYFLTLIICVCLIYGLNFNYLFENKKGALQNKLCIEGVGKTKQALVRIILMTLYLFVLEVLLYIAGCVISEQMTLYFLYFEWETLGILLFLAFAISVHMHMIYSLASDEKHGALLLLITSILMVLCSGLLVPQVYLPQMAQQIGVWSPLYAWSLVGQEIFFGSLDGSLLHLSLIWVIVELLIGVYVSWKKS